MSLRARIVIIVGIVVIIFTILTIILVNNIKKRQTNTSTPTSTESGLTVIDSSNFDPAALTSGATPLSIATTTQITADPVEASKAGVRQFAKVFAERSATYSSDAQLQNIRDVETMVTPNLLAFLKKSTTTTPKNQPFVGVTTKVLTTSLTAWSDTAATVAVQTMRTEQRGTVTTTTQQSATIKLVKQGDIWLVDGIFWDK